MPIPMLDFTNIFDMKIYAVFTPAQLEEFNDEHMFGLVEWPEDLSGCCVHSTNWNQLIIVKLNDDDLINTCAHEASHAVDFMFADIGETTPGAEVKARLIGRITSWLVFEAQRCKKAARQPSTRTPKPPVTITVVE